MAVSLGILSLSSGPGLSFITANSTDGSYFNSLGQYDYLSYSTSLTRVFTAKDPSDNKYAYLYTGTSSSCGSTSSISRSWYETFSSTFGIELPFDTFVENSNNILKIPLVTTGEADHYNLDFSNSTFVTSLTSPSCIRAYVSYTLPENSGGDTPSGDTSDYSQISNAIYSLGAVIIVVCFFSMIYKIFHRLRG